MHTVKKDSWNRTLSAVDLPKAFDRSNAPIYGFECQFAHGDPTVLLCEPVLKGCAVWSHYSVYCVSSTPRRINSVGQTFLKNCCHLCGVSASPFAIAIPKPVAANQRCCI
jgi:hypothetical protein